MSCESPSQEPYLTGPQKKHNKDSESWKMLHNQASMCSQLKSTTELLKKMIIHFLQSKTSQSDQSKLRLSSLSGGLLSFLSANTVPGCYGEGRPKCKIKAVHLSVELCSVVICWPIFLHFLFIKHGD